jgi:hypothetical protein
MFITTRQAGHLEVSGKWVSTWRQARGFLELYSPISATTYSRGPTWSYHRREINFKQKKKKKTFTHLRRSPLPAWLSSLFSVLLPSQRSHMHTSGRIPSWTLLRAFDMTNMSMTGGQLALYLEDWCPVRSRSRLMTNMVVQTQRIGFEMYV